MQISSDIPQSTRDFMAGWVKVMNGEWERDYGSMQLSIFHDVTNHVGRLDTYVAGLKKWQGGKLREEYTRLLRGIYVHAHKGKAKRKHWRPKRLQMVERYALDKTYITAPPHTLHVPSTGTLEINHTFTFRDPHAGHAEN